MLNEAHALGVLAALAHGTRLRIVRTLVAAFPRGVPAGDIGRGLGCPPATLTFHLHHLQRAGLVRSARLSRSIVYTATPDVLTGLADYLMRGCCGGHPELCAPGFDTGARPEPACCGARAEGIGDETPRAARPTVEAVPARECGTSG